MPVVLSIEDGKRYGPALHRAKQSPENDSTVGNLIAFAQSTSQTRKVIPELAKKNAVQVFSFKVSLGSFTFFFFLFI